MIRERRDVGGCFVVKRTIYVSLDLRWSPIRALPPISSERTTIQAKLQQLSCMPPRDLTTSRTRTREGLGFLNLGNR